MWQLLDEISIRNLSKQFYHSINVAESSFADFEGFELRFIYVWLSSKLFYIKNYFIYIHIISIGYDFISIFVCVS